MISGKIPDDKRDVYSAAKSQGYDAKIMRQMTKDGRDEQAPLVQVYGEQLELF